MFKWNATSENNYQTKVIMVQWLIKQKQNFNLKKNVLYIEAYFYVVLISRHLFNIILKRWQHFPT